MNRILMKENYFSSMLNRQLKARGEKELHPLLIRHLERLGIQSIREALDFLYPSEKSVHSPYLMKGMKELVLFLEDDITSGKIITIVGDYDVDGVVATYILYSALLELGAHVNTYIPNRKLEGYGIKETIVDVLHERGTEVIITVDNGISAHAAIERAKDYGMKVYITDHHTPQETLPEADIIINPHQKGCSYPFKHICGSTISYKLSQALLEQFGYEKEFIKKFDEFLALATVADVMPLLDENRYFVKAGLERMKSNPSLSIKALGKVLGVKPENIDETTLGFYFSPILNAPGRLDDANLVLDLFLATTWKEAIIKANICKIHNDERKKLVEEGMNLAQSQLRSEEIQVVVLDVEEGIVGILAGRIQEQTGCPTFVFTPAISNGKPVLRGSARSQTLPLYDSLRKIHNRHSGAFLSWGGHQHAAGLTIEPSFLPVLKEELKHCFEEYGGEKTNEDNFCLGEITEEEIPELALEVERLAPFGEGNPRPVFQVNPTIQYIQRFGNGQHTRLISEKGEYIKFRDGSLNLPSSKVSLFITLSISQFAGKKKIDALVRRIEA